MVEPIDSMKERILSAVKERVSRYGFAHLSVDELTANMGISKKTFYKVFGSKEQMIGQFVDRTMAEIGGALDRIVENDVGFVEKMHALMADLGTLSQRIDTLLASDIHRMMPHLWERIEEFRRRKIHDNFSRLIAQGVQEGFVHKHLHQRLIILAYIASIQAVVRPSVLSEESFSAKEAIQQIVEMLFVGIMTDEGRKIFEQHQESIQ